MKHIFFIMLQNIIKLILFLPLSIYPSFVEKEKSTIYNDIFELTSFATEYSTLS